MGGICVVNDVCEKDLKIIIDFKGNTSQPCNVAAIMPNATLGCINRTIVSKLIAPFYFILVRSQPQRLCPIDTFYILLCTDIKNAMEYYNDTICFIILCLVIFKLQTEFILHRLAVKLFSSNLLQKQPQYYL
uniref:Uncharacterized protein n=2 Tax=Micrurus TaxID=8634 RepID=A0A2D4J9Y0_MICLE